MARSTTVRPGHSRHRNCGDCRDDIGECFDRISHTALLAKLQTFPFLRRVIKGWLKAGVIENGGWFPTEEGTPQGGVCTPPTMVQTLGRMIRWGGWGSWSDAKNHV